jgi:enoyl-CoA hydratase/carnithine racemase
MDGALGNGGAPFEWATPADAVVRAGWRAAPAGGGEIGALVLHRGGSANAWDAAMWRDWGDAVARLRARDTIRAVRGGGRAGASGGGMAQGRERTAAPASDAFGPPCSKSSSLRVPAAQAAAPAARGRLDSGGAQTSLSTTPHPQVVLAAAGPHFTGGLDLAYLRGVFQDRTAGACPARQRAAFLGSIRAMQAAYSALEDAPWPVVAAVQGARARARGGAHGAAPGAQA